MTKKSSEIAKLQSSEVQVIPTKEELQIGMRKTLKELDGKLKNLESPSNYVYKVGGICIREGGYDSGALVVSTIGDVQMLIRLLGQVKRTKREHEEIIKDLNLDIKCLILGLSVDQWIEDIISRIKQITNVKAITDIKAAKTRLETFLSEDDRLIKTLSEVEALLK